MIVDADPLWPLDHPGAAVPVRLDSAREAAEVDVEFVGEPGQARVEVEVESLVSFGAFELLLLGWFQRGGERRCRAAAATFLQPDLDAPALLVDEVGGRLGGDDAHRWMIAELLVRR
jgi:hypothetical protein